MSESAELEQPSKLELALAALKLKSSGDDLQWLNNFESQVDSLRPKPDDFGIDIRLLAFGLGVGDYDLAGLESKISDLMTKKVLPLEAMQEIASLDN